MDKLLGIPEVSKILGFSTLKTRQLCESGKLKSVDAGTKDRKLFMVSETNLRAFINGDAPPKPAPIQKSKGGRPARIDRDVPKVF